MTQALMEALVAFTNRLSADLRAAEREAELVRKYGRCGWCGELLFQPVHDSDCPVRMDQRELMR